MLEMGSRVLCRREELWRAEMRPGWQWTVLSLELSALGLVARGKWKWKWIRVSVGISS